MTLLWQRLGLPGVIDAHTHFLPPNVMAKVRAQFDAAGPLIGHPWPLHYRADDDALVATLRGLGVRRFTALPYAHRAGMAEWLNDWAAGFAARVPESLVCATYFPEPEVGDYVTARVAGGVDVFKVVPVGVNSQIGTGVVSQPNLIYVFFTEPTQASTGATSDALYERTFDAGGLGAAVEIELAVVDMRVVINVAGAVAEEFVEAAFGGPAAGREAEVPFAEAAGGVAALAEVGGQEALGVGQADAALVFLGAELVVEAVAQRMAAGEQAGARGRAGGRRRVEVGEGDAFAEEAVEVGRLDGGVAEVAVAEVVGGDEEEVGRRLRFEGGEESAPGHGWVGVDDIAGVMGGKPCIRGMRLTVGIIAGMLGAGHTIEQGLADYPYPEREDVLQAMRYAAR